MRTLLPDASSRACAFLALLPFLWLAPGFLSGLTPFWGDLTYIHQPWRAFAAQLMQEGRLPLWNPTLYFGMPYAANMQSSHYYPLTIFYFLFGSATATFLYHLAHYALAGTLMFLCLRRWVKPAAALAGAAAYMLGGVMIARVHFINHLAVLSLAPALPLFFRNPWALGLTLALAFFAGYPPFLIGSAAAAWAFKLALDGRRQAPQWLRAWTLGGLLALALSAVLLIPAWELARLCRRTTAGMGLAETLSFGYAWKDLLQWTSPLLLPWSAFNPAVEWWKCSYHGLAGWGLVLLGLSRLTKKRALCFTAWLAVVALVILGESTALSRAVWAFAPPLRYIRYPGNLTYLALPALAFLTAAGAAGLRRPALAAVLVCGELLLYGWAAVPRADKALFTAGGPLVERMQKDLGPAERYLLSPKALEASTGAGVFDWKFRLYGMTNAPFRLRAGGNFGEPLVPRPNYDYMDRLYSEKSAESAAGLMRWAGISRLLTPKRLSDDSPYIYDGLTLWRVHKFAEPSPLARWLGQKEGERLPAVLPAELPAPSGTALSLDWPREDRFVVEGVAPQPGWAYVAEPRYPGWTVELEARGASRLVSPEPALGAFQKVAVPAGLWRLNFRYQPASFRLGAALSTLALLVLGLYWYNRALR